MKLRFRRRLKKLRHRLATSLLGAEGRKARRAELRVQKRERARIFSGIRLLLAVAPGEATALLGELDRSTSQNGQDLFALTQSGRKRNGYFVEFGAADGVRLSNTYLLEREYGWSGIVAEPAANWHRALRANRTCHIETRCIWSESGRVLSFNESPKSMLSTIASFSDGDFHAKRRGRGKQYDVETISLLDLLEQHNAPSLIDYLSVDTEGSEYDILRSFDFRRYRFRVITCEHNMTPNREKVFELLRANGYERRFEALSGLDDWYVDSTAPKP